MAAAGAGAGAGTAAGCGCADLGAAAALVPSVALRFGRIDAVVHNASRFEPDDVAGFSYAAQVVEVSVDDVLCCGFACGFRNEEEGFFKIFIYLFG